MVQQLPGFVPARLVEARYARRISSKAELARRVGVSPSAVSRWESGECPPEAFRVTDIARVLDVPEGYFFRPITKLQKPLFYRSLSSTLKRDKNYQKSMLLWLHDIRAAIANYIDLPPIDIPDVLQGRSHKELRQIDIERIGDFLREHWGLKGKDSFDAVNLLEKAGCIVGTAHIGSAKLDGVCSWSEDNRPHILLSEDKSSFTRRQMDAMHEISHAVLHQDLKTLSPADLKLVEKQAFGLAASILLPADRFANDVRYCSISEFRTLKLKWKVSIKAMIQRAWQLDLISDDRRTSLYKAYSRAGYNKGEPLDNEWSIQQPGMMASAFRMIVESNVRSKRELIDIDLAKPASEVEALVALPIGWFSNGEIHKMQLKKDRRQTKTDAGGEIIDLNKFRSLK